MQTPRFLHKILTNSAASPGLKAGACRAIGQDHHRQRTAELTVLRQRQTHQVSLLRRGV